MEDSFRDKAYDPSKEEVEDEDEDLDHQCQLCSLKTFWEEELKQHMQWKH